MQRIRCIKSEMVQRGREGGREGGKGRKELLDIRIELQCTVFLHAYIMLTYAERTAVLQRKKAGI